MLPHLTNDDVIAAERELCSRSMRHFVKRAWPQIIPQPLRYNWHIDAVCDHFEAVANGGITRLLINIPPGTSKSTLSGVMFPAWLWGAKGRPDYRYIGAAHEQNLAVRDSRMMRELVRSEWYQKLWPLKLMGDQNEKLYFENEHRGFRQACAVASMTGRRGDCIVWDDPLSPEKATSETSRETALRVFKETLPTRLNDPIKSSIIVIMQRLHEGDPSGYILANDLGYEHLLIPMEYEPLHAKTTSIGWSDPRKVKGELLDPARFPPEVIERDKKAMGSYAWAGQMQQTPAPLSGGVWKLDWFLRHDKIPEQVATYVHSWDTAYKKDEHNDPSSCTVMRIGNNAAFVQEVINRRMEYPELKKAIISLAARDNPSVILIEDKASGQSLIQELRAETGLPVIAVKAVADKLTRAVAAAGTIEAGRISLPNSAEWLYDYENQIVSFPNGKHDDMVDSTSQFINWWRTQSYGLWNEQIKKVFEL